MRFARVKCGVERWACAGRVRCPGVGLGAGVRARVEVSAGGKGGRVGVRGASRSARARGRGLVSAKAISQQLPPTNTMRGGQY